MSGPFLEDFYVAGFSSSVSGDVVRVVALVEDRVSAAVATAISAEPADNALTRVRVCSLRKRDAVRLARALLEAAER